MSGRHQLLLELVSHKQKNQKCALVERHWRDFVLQVCNNYITIHIICVIINK